MDARDEQILADKYITSSCKILELGGRYGTVSCVANNKLDDPKQHVVVEPDKNVLSVLHTNRSTHNAYFHIYPGVVSNKPLYISYNGYATMTNENGSVEVPSLSLQQLTKQYNVKFNTLIADCEGCFPTFVRDNPDFVKQLDLILLERDQATPEAYAFVDDFLSNNGFMLVDSLNNGFQQVWKRTC